MRKHHYILAAAALVLVACGSGSDDSSGNGGIPPDAGDQPSGPVYTDPPTLAPTSTIDTMRDLILDPILLEQFVMEPFSSDLEAYWVAISVEQGQTPATSNWQIIQLSEQVPTACTDESGALATMTADQGPFYCHADDTVYVSAVQMSTYIKGMGNLPEATSEVVVKSTMAHEKGHDLIFQFGWYDNWVKSNPTSVKPMELAADCLGGKALVGISQSTVLNNTGVVLDNQAFVDLIYDAFASGDFLEDNPGHHGTPRERAKATLDGLTADVNDYSACMAYMGLKPATS